MTSRRALVIKTGEALPSLVAERGNYEEWIIRGLGLPRESVDVAAVFEGDPLPDPSLVSGVVITGSSAMVTERALWSERTGAWLVGVVESDLPVLGICYGHQLIADAMGGRVEKNPRGREIGTIDVLLRAEASDDRLFSGLPANLRVHATHVESVVELPSGTRCLGTSDGDPHQVLAFGENVWGTQFHPEFDAEVVRRYIGSRRETLIEEGLDADVLYENASDSPHGDTILRRFGAFL